MKKSEEFLENLIGALPEMTALHVRDSLTYRLVSNALKHHVSALFSKVEPVSIEVGVLGGLKFPYVNMGNVDSLNLFELDEFIIFSYYWQNRKRYRRVADLGANLGLHSIAMSHLSKWS